MTKNEAIPLYRDGRHYDALNSFLVADIPFYVEEAKCAAGTCLENPHAPATDAGRMGHLAGGTGDPVLELACGTGRLTIPIAQSGVEIVGLDIAPSMLVHAGGKAEVSGGKYPLLER